MGDTSHGMMSRSVLAGSPRKNNSQEVARRRAELQHQLEQRREEARRQQEQKMAKAAAQKEERLARHREIQQREMLRAKAVLDRRAQVLAEAEEKKAAVLAKAHATASRLSQQRTRPVFAFGSSTPRELGYLTQLTREQKVYDRKLQPSTPPPQPTATAGRFSLVPTGATSGRAHAPATSSAMTRSLYVTHSESKTRPKLSPTVMTQSMVTNSKGIPNRASRPTVASSTAQRAVAQRRTNATQPSGVARGVAPAKAQNAAALRKSTVPMVRLQKAAASQNKRNPEQPKNAEYKTKVETLVKTSNAPLNNSSFHSVVEAVAHEKPNEVEETPRELEEKPEETEDKQTVEVVHDSPSTENAHVNNMVQDALAEGTDGEAMEVRSQLEAKEPAEEKLDGRHGEISKEELHPQELHVEREIAVDNEQKSVDELPEDGRIEHTLGERSELDGKEVSEGEIRFAHTSVDEHSVIEDITVEDQNDAVEESSVHTHASTEAVSNKKIEVEEVAQRQSELRDEDANTTVVSKEETMDTHQPKAIEVPHCGLELDSVDSEQVESGTNQMAQEQNEKDKLVYESLASGSDTERATSSVNEGKFGEPERQQTDEEHRLAQERLRTLQFRAEQEQREREERKARLAAIMSRTRGTPTAVVAPTQNIITEESGVHEPLKDVERAPTPNDSAAPHVLSHTAASVLQKLASSNPRLLSVLQRNGSNPSLADELTAADPSMTLPGQPDEPSSPSRDRTVTASLHSLDFHADVNHTTLAMK
ncbi:unnamed protein product [Toxocara canis]|uniref:Microtubule-associated protein n=1 Tax=Toxocara canis TaxID=6265 RepID=A0A183V3H3_TOXCA|nr:unnamed protein product [Toxocara canis]